MRKLKFPVGLAVCGLLAAALLVGRPIVQAQGAGPVLNPAQVLGPTVTFTWSTVAGATTYVLRAGVVPGQYPLVVDIGPTATYIAQAPAVGTYYVQVAAIVGGVPVLSNESIVPGFVDVRAPGGTDGARGVHERHRGGDYLESRIRRRNGERVRAAGRNLSGRRGPRFARLPASTTSVAVPGVGAGTYYLRVAGINQGGPGPASNEATLVMPAGGGCSAPPARTISPLVFGQYVRLSWAGVPTAAGYVLNYAAAFSGSSPVPANINSVTVPNAPLGVYQATLTTVFGCGQNTVGPPATITVDGAPPQGRVRRTRQPVSSCPSAGRMVRSSNGLPASGPTCCARPAGSTAATIASCSRPCGGCAPSTIGMV